MEAVECRQIQGPQLDARRVCHPNSATCWGPVQREWVVLVSVALRVSRSGTWLKNEALSGVVTDTKHCFPF